MTVEIDIAVSSPARLGEGAVWDTEDACLWWVDIKAGLIHRFDPATGVNSSFDFGQPVGCLARRAAVSAMAVAMHALAAVRALWLCGT